MSVQNAAGVLLSSKVIRCGQHRPGQKVCECVCVCVSSADMMRCVSWSEAEVRVCVCLCVCVCSEVKER